ncbi:NADH dehydrogenase subunit G [Nakamurella panacisegetis]|uniref:NADH-quinone oxidoreductase n=1 Tax=Nakamurella panacisegetis TaxID=1090615 RepID=A0A1H0NU60_9ACTN|nr:NADH-quinone oxidoreductase subunit G [Nakamurella panacisegetis]SDO96287.1 NADH dehydrogenase subunit G [Nakamurella panacisegetis]
MTQVVSPTTNTGGSPEDRPVPEGHVRLTIDGVVLDAPKGELVIRAAERIGTAIPRFCDHPLLEPVGACRQCLVEIEMGGRPMPKPQASCTQTVADGMVVRTQLSSPVAEKAQRSNLEFLLLNHPLDCPICDKGGECPLQNQTLANGAAESRMHDAKRVFTKPIAVSTQILLDRERCVLCQRCTRFSDQIAGDKFIDLLERGSAQQIGINSAEPFQSYFSGNTIQICPVGALTSAAYRFRSRPFDLVSTPTVCEHCADGCAMRTDHRSIGVTRRLAGLDPAVNEEWNCDKGRFGFTYTSVGDRILRPMVRNAEGTLEPVSWTEAMSVAAAGLATARDTGGVGVLTGGRLTVTDAYAYAKFTRLALRTNDIDFRARAHSAEEAEFLAARVTGRTPDTDGVTFASLETAPVVLLVGLEPEEESPILFLRLRKASRRGVPVYSVGAVRSRGLDKMDGHLLTAVPGQEMAVLQRLSTEVARAGAPEAPVHNQAAVALRAAGAVVLVGERAAEIPGLLTAVADLVDRTGAKLAWVPRRAGERGALDAGAIGNLLPGGRPIADDAARAEVESAWGASVPAAPGRDTSGILDAVGAGGLSGLLIGGVEVADLPDPAAAIAAIAAAGFVVSLELRRSAVTELADVVFPVAAVAEKSGSFVNWEGRNRPFGAALPEFGTLDEGRILDTLGVEMDVDLYTQTPVAARADMGRLGIWNPSSAWINFSGVDESGDSGHSSPNSAKLIHAGEVDPREGGPREGGPREGTFAVATWRMNLDGGRGLDGEPHLAGTAKPDVARLSAGDAARLDVNDGDAVRVVGPSGGSVTLPLEITVMADGSVWLPSRIGGTPLGVLLGGGVTTRVRVTRASGNDTAAERQGL